MSTATISCGCCQRDDAAAPRGPENPPGLSALSYRVGTHGSFKRAMTTAIAGAPALSGLTTREDDDPAIALLDAWAAVLDVLTFYQERIANEGYLRTSTERRSVLELSRSIGYELRPGVAASTHIAFTLEATIGAPERVEVPVGTRIQSTPKDGEQPQTFETVEVIDARPVWNALRPVRLKLMPPRKEDPTITLRGTATKLQPGDALLIVGEGQKDDPRRNNWDVRRVKSLREVPDETDPTKGYTIVTFDRPLGHDVPLSLPPNRSPTVHAFRQQAKIFGYSAPSWKSLPVSLRVGETSPQDGKFIPGAFADRASTWVDAPFAAATDHINLDAVYPRVLADSWIVLTRPGYTELFHVTKVQEEGRVDYLLSASTTRLTLAGQNISFFSPRRTLVFAASEQLEIAPTPLLVAARGDERRIQVEGETIELDTVVPGLSAGRVVAVSGLDITSRQPVAEIATVKTATDVQTTTVLGTEKRTTLELTARLAHAYLRDSVTINANVASATHGESKEEVLGSGDASRPFQRFALKMKPLTFVSAATPSGTKSTLEVRVNGLRWDEAQSFYDAGPDDHAYQLRIADDASATVTFGDGARGARAPSGVENVRASYRVGIGLGGLVEARQLSLLLKRPLGVKEAVNPLPATGAADPETLDAARTNAPLTVLTLDRIVSLQDIEDFARAFAGVGKAQAALLWSGQHQVAHLTVAGANGAPIVAGSAVHDHLLQALDGARHVDRPVVVQSYRLDGSGSAALTFDVEARLIVNPRAIAADVLANARATLLDLFSFDRRAFGQSVVESEVVTALQRTADVVAVEMVALHFSTAPVTLQTRLPVQTARVDNRMMRPAELLTIRPQGIRLIEVRS